MVNLKKAKAMYIQKQQELEKVCYEDSFLVLVCFCLFCP